MPSTTAAPGGARWLLVALASAAAFGSSGAFVKPLLEAGWSPALAVCLRTGLAGLVLLGPALWSLRGRWRVLVAHHRLVLAYAAVSVVGTQALYFAAIQRMPVSQALLIEYTGPVLLVLFVWARTRRSPGGAVLFGAAVSLAGLVLVIGPAGGTVDPVGVLLAGAAAVCLAAYFAMSARPTPDLPAIALVAAGLILGSLGLAIAGAVGLLPFKTGDATVALLGADVPWFAPLAGVALVSTAFAYLTGLVAARPLGARVASFVALAEVVFATVLSWVLLGEALSPAQLVGGGLIVVGVVLVRAGAREVPPPATVRMAEREDLLGLPDDAPVR